MDNLDVHPRIISSLRKARISDYVGILSRSSGDLMRATQLSQADVRGLQREAALAVVKQPPVTALNIYKKECQEELIVQRLSVGCNVLDNMLQGGIVSRGITEVVGESASGKTQLCIQLCLMCQLSPAQGGLNGGAAYICTEDVFPSKRLAQMIQQYNAVHKTTINFSDNIFIEHTSDIESLWHCVKKRVPTLLAQYDVKLIIIDSVAALFRCEFGVGETVQRAKKLSQFAAHLHSLSATYNIPVICVNQVSDNIGGQSSNGVVRSTVPALGLSWSNLVTTRIMLSRTPHTVAVQQHNRTGELVSSFESPVRAMEVVFAPHLPPVTCHYVIDQQGVKGISDT